MKANEINLLGFLHNPVQFVIPIFQRPYSWTLVQCRQLWDDIEKTALAQQTHGHFVGSVVYIQEGLIVVGLIPQLMLIDGQQRLTTVSLLLCALASAIKAKGGAVEISDEQIRGFYLFNQLVSGDSRYKILLTQNDRETFIRLLEDKDLPKAASNRIVENHQFFIHAIARSKLSVDDIMRGMHRLLIVEISLDRTNDNPQLIFESLNSTGLDLSQADLIRNYVLMGLEPDEQTELYTDLWHPMEQDFDRTDGGWYFNRFARDYLTLKTGRIPKVDDVYSAFKGYVQSQRPRPTRDIVEDMRRLARLYVSIAFAEDVDHEIQALLRDLRELQVTVSHPFLLEVFDDLKQGRLARNDLIEILGSVESYVFRRAICGIPTNSLDQTFGHLARELDKDHYLESFKAALLLKDSYRRFPGDDEFRREFVSRDLYNFRGRNFLLRRLESYGNLEIVDVEGCTIEHILPQTENLSIEWRRALGENWEETRALYLHTIGNLTLTVYNSSLSDRPFLDKRNMKGGFIDSRLHLSHSLANLDHWDRQEIQKRGQTLADLALKIWPLPALPSELLAKYRTPSPGLDAGLDTVESHEQHAPDPVRELFRALRNHILNLDASIREVPLRGYIAYKATTNFVDVVLRANAVSITLNLRYDDIFDPKGLCRNVTNVGHWGNGDVEVNLSAPGQLQDVMALIRQSLDKHLDGGDG